jgi:hypothetical protein
MLCNAWAKLAILRTRTDGLPLTDLHSAGGRVPEWCLLRITMEYYLDTLHWVYEPCRIIDVRLCITFVQADCAPLSSWHWDSHSREPGDWSSVYSIPQFPTARGVEATIDAEFAGLHSGRRLKRRHVVNTAPLRPDPSGKLNSRTLLWLGWTF